jgi:eukaryotic-like serine/threonine-protein kinase
MPEPVTDRCPRCGLPRTGSAEGGGICLRCLGERALAFAASNDDARAPTTEPPNSFDTSSQPTPGDSGSSVPTNDFSSTPKDRLTTAPRQLGAYELVEEIGRGGMGRVFAARHTRLGTLVALKVISDGRFATAEQEMRFVREAQTAARLRHPYIVAVHDAGRDQGLAYYAMDLVPDGDLAQRLRERQRPLAAREAALLVHKVTTAVAYAHREGILHRDLKPSNILLEGDEPRVGDFGLAAELGPGGELTAATRLLGTPMYLAPEVFARGAKAASAASDVYALGAILYEALTGRPPFFGESAGEDAAAAASALRQHEVVAPRLLAPGVPRDLETIVLKCLEKNSAGRYPSAAELADDLARFLDGRPIVARPISAPARFARWCNRRPALAAVWFLAVALAIGSSVAAFMIAGAREETRRQLGAARHAEARAHALTRRMGRRADALAAVSAAARIQSSLELRNTAIAALALPDLEIVRRWPVASQVLAFANFDPTGAGYVLMQPTRMTWHETGTHRQWSLLSPADKVQSNGMPGFSPDGRRLVMHASDSTIHAWERTADGARIIWSLADRPFPWPRPIYPYGNDIVCSPDGRHVTATIKGGGFSVHDLSDGREVGRWNWEFMPTCIRWSPDGRLLAVACAAREAKGRWHLVDAATLATIRSFETGGNIFGVAWSIAGDLVAVSTEKSEIRIYRARDGELVRLLTAGDSAIQRLAFFGNDNSLLTSEGAESLFRWRSRQNGEEFLLIEPVQANAISVTPDGQSLFTTNGKDEGLHFRVVPPVGLRTFAVDPDLPNRSFAGPGSLSFSPDGGQVLATHGGGASITRTSDGICIAKYSTGNPRDYVTALFAPDGKAVYVCGNVTGLFRLPLRSDATGVGFGERVLVDPMPDCYLRDISDDGKRMVVVSPRQGRVKIFALGPEGATLATEWSTPSPYGAAFGRDGQQLLVNHDDTMPGFKSEGVRVWDIAKREPVRTLDAPVSADAAWNDRAGVAITTNGKSKSFLWRTDTWAHGAPLPPEVQGNSTCFAIAPDGHSVAIATPRGVHLIDVALGRTIAVLTRGGVAFGYPNAVVFSRDGRQLAAQNGDALVHVWDLPALRAELRKLQLDW